MTFPPRKPSRVALRGGCQHVCKAHALAHRPATARHNRRRGERLQLRHGNKQKALRNIRSHTELLLRREWTSGLNRHLLRNIRSNTELLSRREWTSGQKLSSNARPSAAPVRECFFIVYYSARGEVLAPPLPPLDYSAPLPAEYSPTNG